MAEQERAKGKSLVGFVDINKIEGHFFFETNPPLTEEQEKNLKEIREEFVNSTMELHRKKLEQYKETVRTYLRKQDMIVKEVPMPLDVRIALNILDL